MSTNLLVTDVIGLLLVLKSLVVNYSLSYAQTDLPAKVMMLVMKLLPCLIGFSSASLWIAFQEASLGKRRYSKLISVIHTVSVLSSSVDKRIQIRGELLLFSKRRLSILRNR